MPAITTRPLSSSMPRRKVGSSSARRRSASLMRSWSAAVFGSTVTRITGSGKLIDSSTTGCPISLSVSPV